MKDFEWLLNEQPNLNLVDGVLTYIEHNKTYSVHLKDIDIGKTKDQYNIQTNITDYNKDYNDAYCALNTRMQLDKYIVPGHKAGSGTLTINLNKSITVEEYSMDNATFYLVTFNLSRIKAFRVTVLYSSVNGELTSILPSLSDLSLDFVFSLISKDLLYVKDVYSITMGDNTRFDCKNDSKLEGHLLDNTLLLEFKGGDVCVSYTLKGTEKLKITAYMKEMLDTSETSEDRVVDKLIHNYDNATSYITISGEDLTLTIPFGNITE